MARGTFSSCLTVLLWTHMTSMSWGLLNPCSMSPEQLHQWISRMELPSRHPHTAEYYADKLLRARVDGNELCMAPPEWLLDTLERPVFDPVDDDFDPTGHNPTCTHACSSHTTDVVTQAINEWNAEEYNSSFLRFLRASQDEGAPPAPSHLAQTTNRQSHTLSLTHFYRNLSSTSRTLPIKSA